MAEHDETAGATAAAAGDRQLMFQKVYVRDLSFESPDAPKVFGGTWEPKVNLNMATSTNSLGEDRYEVVLDITIEAKQGEQTAFLAEVQQAGIFTLSGFQPDELKRLLGGYCPGVVFPYAREVVSDLVAKGGFPQLLLQPVNFDALYVKHQDDMQNAAKEASATEERH